MTTKKNTMLSIVASVAILSMSLGQIAYADHPSLDLGVEWPNGWTVMCYNDTLDVLTFDSSSGNFDAVKAALDIQRLDWNAEPASFSFFTTNVNLCDNRIGAASLPSSWNGFTPLTHNGVDILDADIWFNVNKQWTASSCPDPASSTTRNINYVGLHEFGHAFGFGHSTQSPTHSIMYNFYDCTALQM